jgi:signal transduction histidine kinase/ActR/RegA family two-component response regulator
MRELGLRSYVCVPLRARGRVLGVLTFASAESGRRYTAGDLAFAEELAHRAAIAIENAQLYREAREADRRKEEFLAMLAHELRNPLAPIRNALEILRLPDTNAATAVWAREMMVRQVQHLVRLVDDLLDLARILRGKIELHKERVGLATVVSRAIETSQPVIDAQRHHLNVSLPAEPLILDADPVRLAQVIGNLLTNAAKYTEPGGRIDLTARLEGDEIVVRARDTGIGIAAEMLPKIFDMFVQVHPASARTHGGLGIGLTLVKSLVELHGGRVEAHSEGPGQGSEFVVRLRAAQSGSSPSERPSGGPTRAGIPSRRVLVVDDHADAANTLAQLLRIAGHDVQVAHDGPAALAAAVSRRPDVVFLDIGMPGMDGYEVARRMRREPALEGVLLAALTGWGQEEDRRRTREAGFDYHLVKPGEPDALNAILRDARSSNA